MDIYTYIHTHVYVWKPALQCNIVRCPFIFLTISENLAWYSRAAHPLMTTLPVLAYSPLWIRSAVLVVNCIRLPLWTYGKLGSTQRGNAKAQRRRGEIEGHGCGRFFQFKTFLSPTTPSLLHLQPPSDVPRPASPGTFAATIERLRVFLPISRPSDGRRPQSPFPLKKIASISTLKQKPEHDGPVTTNLTQNVKT